MANRFGEKAANPYIDHYYSYSDCYAAGQYEGYQGTVNTYRYAVNEAYRDGVDNGQLVRGLIKDAARSL